MSLLPDTITIGELSARSGVATSALRFYESLGLIRATRTDGNQRRFVRSTLRRVAFIRAARQIGLSMEEIGTALERLPTDRTPTKADWARLSRGWRGHLEARIHELERLRDDLTSCIGCGCLSLRTCRLLNADDTVADRGPGARYLIED
jgi:MerR family redox-sensitive transcriptional activator SoxR